MLRSEAAEADDILMTCVIVVIAVLPSLVAFYFVTFNADLDLPDWEEQY